MAIKETIEYNKQIINRKELIREIEIHSIQQQNIRIQQTIDNITKGKIISNPTLEEPINRNINAIKNQIDDIYKQVKYKNNDEKSILENDKLKFILFAIQKFESNIFNPNEEKSFLLPGDFMKSTFFIPFQKDYLIDSIKSLTKLLNDAKEELDAREK